MKLPTKSRWLLLIVVIVVIPVIYFWLNSGAGEGTTGSPVEQGGADMQMKNGSSAQDIVISSQRLQTLGVKIDSVRYRKLEKVIRTVGRVDYDERLLTTISTKVSGWIEKLYVDYTGKFVEKGDRLYEIYSPEVVTTEEEYLLALQGKTREFSGDFPRLEQDAATLLESTRQRFELWDVPPKHIRELERTKRVAKTMRIHSPGRGFVITKNVLEGKYIHSGHELFVIADISNVWVYADIYEYEIPLISEGQSAELELSYYPGETFRGKVSYIYPYLEEKTRTIKIRFEFPNPGWRLKPGMFATVKLHSLVAEQGLAVPEEAVLDTGERQLVFVYKAEGVFEPREVLLGIKAEKYYQVLEGLAAGERVAVSANFLIDSESRLGSAMMKMKM